MEDFVDGKEEYLRKYMDPHVYNNSTRWSKRVRIVEEALFFFPQDILMRANGVYEAKRFYSKQDKKYLKILGFADRDGGQLRVYFKDKNPNFFASLRYPEIMVEDLRDY